MSLKTLLKSHQINLDEQFYRDIEIFITDLQVWGRVHNLSGNLSIESIHENILDSLYPLKFINKYKSFADIGTGAGYPGLVLAIASRNMQSHLIEPRIKRVSFLNLVKAKLRLDNLSIHCKRVEEVGDLKVDLITSRAVTNTSLLVDITQSIKKDKSSYLFYKGSMLDNELQEANVNNYEVHQRKDRNYLYIRG